MYNIQPLVLFTLGNTSLGFSWHFLYVSNHQSILSGIKVMNKAMSKLRVFLLVALSALVVTIASAARVYSGRMSTFGGPNDSGVSSNEGLAIYSSASQRPEIFLSRQPAGTTGLARRLDPSTFYIAMRWNYGATSKNYLRRNKVIVRNPRNGRSAYALPADWGPADWTGRIADLSPGLANYLGVRTDNVVEVTIP